MSANGLDFVTRHAAAYHPSGHPRGEQREGNSVPFGGHLQRRRPAYLPGLASWVALAVAVSGVVVYAVQADGYQAHTAELNDGGIWVTSNRDGSYGRINKPIGELDGTVFSRFDSNLDIVQDGSSVVGIDLSEGIVVPLDPAQMRAPDGEEAAIPGNPRGRDGRRQPGGARHRVRPSVGDPRGPHRRPADGDEPGRPDRAGRDGRRRRRAGGRPRRHRVRRLRHRGPAAHPRPAGRHGLRRSDGRPSCPASRSATPSP